MIPTEPIGSIPRPTNLIDAVARNGGRTDDPALAPLFDEAVRDTVARFEATGSPVISDGEQRKYHNFFDYCVHGLPNMAPDGFKSPSLPATSGACRGSSVGRFGTRSTATATSRSRSATPSSR